MVRMKCFALVLALISTGVAQAGILGFEGPLVADATGNWREFRTKGEVALASEAAEDTLCRARTTSNLRQLFFEHFRYYADHSKTEIGDVEIARFAKVLGMAPYESSGASAAITDMKYNGSNETLRFFRGDNRKEDVEAAPGLHSSVDSLNKLFRLEKIKFDRQTNFGHLQMSADRLVTNVGGAGDLAEKTILDMKALYKFHPEELIDRCGTRHMFKDDEAVIRKAFDRLQTCEVGYLTKEKVQCFGRWASLCPNYNLTLALIATPRYFATKNKQPLCAKTFRKILRGGRTGSGVKIPSSPKTVPTSCPRPAAGFEGSSIVNPWASNPLTTGFQGIKYGK